MVCYGNWICFTFTDPTVVRVQSPSRAFNGRRERGPTVINANLSIGKELNPLSSSPPLPSSHRNLPRGEGEREREREREKRKEKVKKRDIFLTNFRTIVQRPRCVKVISRVQRWGLICTVQSISCWSPFLEVHDRSKSFRGSSRGGLPGGLLLARLFRANL